MRIILDSFAFLTCVLIAKAYNDTDKLLEKLENERSQLIVKIQQAIDDSAKILQKSNDTDSETGLHHLRELEKQFNETVIDDEFNNILSNISGRRHQPRYLQKGKLTLDLFDVAGLFGKKDKFKKKTREERERNHELMKIKLQEWLDQRERERETIKQYKVRSRSIGEKCPNFGNKKRGKRKKKKKSRRAFDLEIDVNETRRNRGRDGRDGGVGVDGVDGADGADGSKGGKGGKGNEGGKGGEGSTTKMDCEDKGDKAKNRTTTEERRNKYPCCRKCCKSSYLGCL